MAFLSLLMGGRSGTVGSEPHSFNNRSGADGSPFDASTPGQLASEGRFCRLLGRDAACEASDTELAAAWKAMESEMALVPGGDVPGTLISPGGDARPNSAEAARAQPLAVDSFYMDRLVVTNRDFARFVAAGGYEDMELWPPEIWQNVLQFVDRTGISGPRLWNRGEPPRAKEGHPVVGVCWYEAAAYARWIGKRLPTSAEWYRAGSWSCGSDGRVAAVRYPWGNAFEPDRANTWIGGPGETVPADHHRNGCTPNGIYQLVGNVWEWVDSRYYGPTVPQGYQVSLEQPMAEIRGGAFDTYFETQATLGFRSGQPLFYRGANLGFRCCVSVDALRRPPDPSAFL